MKFPLVGLKSLSEPQPSLSIVFLFFPTVEPLILTLQKEACKVPVTRSLSPGFIYIAHNWLPALMSNRCTSPLSPKCFQSRSKQPSSPFCSLPFLPEASNPCIYYATQGQEVPTRAGYFLPKTELLSYKRQFTKFKPTSQIYSSKVLSLLVLNS